MIRSHIVALAETLSALSVAPPSSKARLSLAICASMAPSLSFAQRNTSLRASAKRAALLRSTIFMSYLPITKSIILSLKIERNAFLRYFQFASKIVIFRLFSSPCRERKTVELQSDRRRIFFSFSLSLKVFVQFRYSRRRNCRIDTIYPQLYNIYVKQVVYHTLRQHKRSFGK